MPTTPKPRRITLASVQTTLKKAASAGARGARAGAGGVARGGKAYTAWLERKNREIAEEAARNRAERPRRMQAAKEALEEEIALEQEIARLRREKNAALLARKREEATFRRRMQELEEEENGGGPGINDFLGMDCGGAPRRAPKAKTAKPKKKAAVKSAPKPKAPGRATRQR